MRTASRLIVSTHNFLLFSFVGLLIIFEEKRLGLQAHSRRVIVLTRTQERTTTCVGKYVDFNENVSAVLNRKKHFALSHKTCFLYNKFGVLHILGNEVLGPTVRKILKINVL